MKAIFCGILAITMTLALQAQVEKRDNNETTRAAWDDYSWDPVYSQHISQYERAMNNDYGLLMGQMNITDEQKDQLKKISDNAKMRMVEVYSNPDLTNDQVREQHIAIMSDRKNQIYAVLTSDQREQYASWYGTHPYNWEDMSWRSQWANDNMSLDNMRTRLNLTDNQYKRLTELNASFKQKKIAIMNDESISKEERYSRIKALHDEKQATFRTLLNADQVKKFEMKDNGKVKIKTVENGESKKIKTKPVKTPTSTNTEPQ